MRAFVLIILFLFHVNPLPQSTAEDQKPPPTSTGYTCSPTTPTTYPCQSYALYRVGSQSGPYPPLLDLPSIADLFSLPRLTLARASQLPANSTLLPRSQPLLVPLTCACGSTTRNLSYAPLSYRINPADTFYTVSSYKFGNLTSYPAVERVNPDLQPTNLTVGVDVVFPIFCKCPPPAAPPSNNRSGSNSSELDKNSIIITYSFQPNDTYRSLAKGFGSDVESLRWMNGPEEKVQPYLTILIPVAKVPPPLVLNFSATEDVATAATAPTSTTEKEKEGERDGAVVGLAIGLGFMGFLWVMCVLGSVWFVRKRRLPFLDEKRRDGNEARFKGRGNNGRYRRRSGSDERLMTDISEWLDKYRVFGVEELAEATDGFDGSRLIQGSVYKGMIDGEVYAIKKMKWNACDELKILQKVNHTNLVKLEGFCIEPIAGSCYLIYEYIENGSLNSWLHNPAHARRLDWRARLRIALDLAHGLQYIHEHTWPRVVHKDIKSSNILLDAKMRAKIANFGLAKTGCNAVTTHIVGTQGYIAPEYLVDGLVTTKMDVFAYGVVLLELVSGREAIGEGGEMLWMEVEGIFQAKDGRLEGRVLAWMDKTIMQGQSVNMESVMNVMNVARACLQNDPAKRPSMVDVAYGLSKFDDMFSDFSEDGLATGGANVVGR